MKKVLFVLLMCFGITNFVFADPIGFGLKAGANLSNLIFDAQGSSGNELQFGLIGGGFVDFKISDRFSVQPEALFTMKGASQNGIYVTAADSPEILGTTSFSYHYQYLEIPVFLKINLPTTSHLSINFFSGPSIAFPVSANFHAFFNNKDIDLMPLMNSPEYGIILGGGLELSKFLIDLRYEFGLTWPLRIQSDYNRVLSLMVGYRLL